MPENFFKVLSSLKQLVFIDNIPDSKLFPENITRQWLHTQMKSYHKSFSPHNCRKVYSFKHWKSGLSASRNLGDTIEVAN